MLQSSMVADQCFRSHVNHLSVPFHLILLRFHHEILSVRALAKNIDLSMQKGIVDSLVMALSCTREKMRGERVSRILP